MGTRGYQVWRFRKRYYRSHISMDSYPDGLGRLIAAAIPQNPKEYSDWLQAQRTTLEKCEARWKDALMVKAKVDDPGDKSIYEQEEPTLLAPMNDLFIEWIYILDLDREVFTINNSVHLKLDQVPHVRWMGALAAGRLGDAEEDLGSVVIVPGYVREEALTNLVAHSPVQQLNARLGPAHSHKVGAHFSNVAVHISASNTKDGKLGDLPCRLVSPKRLTDVPWRRQHDFVFRQNIFGLWSAGLQDLLAVNLLQWTPDDLPFREIAFAIICLASGGDHIAVLPKSVIKDNGIWGMVQSKYNARKEKEFVSVLASGAYLKGNPASSSPEGTMYWLGGVLVVLASQLYRPKAVEEVDMHDRGAIA